MKRIISCVVVVFVSGVICGKLDNTYLPPNSARTAGGNENILNTPIGDQSNESKYTIASVGNHQESSPISEPAYNEVQRENNNIPQPSPVYGPSHHSQSNVLRPNLVRNHQESPSNHEQLNNYNQRSTNVEARANLIKFDNDNDGNGNYHFDFETENRIHHEEHGQLKRIDDGEGEAEAVVVQGSYSYIGDDGRTYTVTYIADENGFQPAGEHINEAIVKTASEAAKSASVNGVRLRNGFNGYDNGGVIVKSENVNNINGGYRY